MLRVSILTCLRKNRSWRRGCNGTKKGKGERKDVEKATHLEKKVKVRKQDAESSKREKDLYGCLIKK